MPALFQLGNVLSRGFHWPAAVPGDLGPVTNDIDVSNACDWRGL
jgi:hypothetical protein